MAKKAKAKLKTSLFVSDPVDLRRWCIEQAMRWPSTSDGSYVSNTFNSPRYDADVIGRAKQLLNWVTNAE